MNKFIATKAPRIFGRSFPPRYGSTADPETILRRFSRAEVMHPTDESKLGCIQER